jgi:hypothetical protein
VDGVAVSLCPAALELSAVAGVAACEGEPPGRGLLLVVSASFPITANAAIVAAVATTAAPAARNQGRVLMGLTFVRDRVESGASCGAHLACFRGEFRGAAPQEARPGGTARGARVSGR